MAVNPAAEARPVLVALPAEIDATNARDVRIQIIAAALRPGVRVVIADMTPTKFCDSMGVRALLLAHQRAARSGVELRLLRPGRNVRRVLELTGADRVLAIYEGLDEAMMPGPRDMA
ncbi:MAG TPA: STAS domain-containing protein [Streptosporangiaceae bacterium]|jgi:anti-anti-sigma factor